VRKTYEDGPHVGKKDKKRAHELKKGRRPGERRTSEGKSSTKEWTARSAKRVASKRRCSQGAGSHTVENEAIGRGGRPKIPVKWSYAARSPIKVLSGILTERTKNLPDKKKKKKSVGLLIEPGRHHPALAHGRGNQNRANG